MADFGSSLAPNGVPQRPGVAGRWDDAPKCGNLVALAMSVAATPPLEDRLAAGRPRLGALAGLRDRVLAGVASRGPRMVGRYRLGAAIGSGAFGTVHEADDPELRRKVAIKLFATGPGRERERVLREARMLATVSSPNVVHVFEVGVVEDATAAPYLVMELVEGPTLREFLRTQGPRPWSEIVAVVLAAARGLWAAHRQGVVHRDFKPDNVILATDGRPRVVDFGLARAVGDDDFDTQRSSGDPSDSMLTPTGAVMGTPAYMAPECFAGPCTPRSDQYSLCVTLYEALFGSRPFQVRSTEELRQRIGTEDPKVPRDRRGVPPRLIAALMRGLHRDPDARHRDLGQLITALEGTTGTRRLGAMGIGAAGLVVAFAAFGAGAQPDPCRTGAGAWRRFDADASASQAAYAARWQATEEHLCEASDGAELPVAQRHCLDRRLGDVAAVREVLAELAPADRVALDDPFRTLPAPEDCGRTPSTTDAAPIVADAGAVARIESGLSRLHARMIASNPAEGLALSTDLLVEARELHHGPLVAELAHAHARLLLLASQHREAAAAFEEAFHVAQAAGLDRDAARAAAELVRLHGYFLGDPRTARRWAEHAQSSSARAGVDPSRNRVLAEGLAGLAEREGDLLGAAALLRQAIAAAIAEGGAHDGITGGLHNHLGAVLLQLDDAAGAAEAFTEAESILAATNGACSPSRAAALDNLGVALVQLGRHDEALAHHREALAIREATLDADHLDLGASHGNLADVLEHLGRHDEALASIDRALALFTDRLGSDHPHVATGVEIRERILAHASPRVR